MNRPAPTRALRRLAPAGLLALAALPAAADGWVHLAPWTLGGGSNDSFGQEVELEDGWSFAQSLESGLVEVRRLVGAQYLTQQYLNAPGDEQDAWYGKHIELVDGRLYVAAPHTDGGSHDQGALHVYDLEDGEWTLAETVLSPAPFASERFGYSFAVDGDWLAVSTNHSEAGYVSRVHVYRRTGGVWSFLHLIQGFPTGSSGVQLELRQRDGSANADLFIGQPTHDSPQGEAQAGLVDHVLLSPIAAYVGPTLQPAELTTVDRFGSALDFDGQQLFVGAPNVGNGSYDGRVYVYDFQPNGLSAQLALRQTLWAGVNPTAARFGIDLAVDGKRLAIGAAGTTVEGYGDVGAVHVYRRNLLGFWVVEDVLEPANPTWAGRLGTVVALDGAHVLAGAPNSGATGELWQPGVGAAYLFSLTPKDLAGGQAPANVLATAKAYGPVEGPLGSLALAIDQPPVPGELSTLELSGGDAFAVPFLFWGLAPLEVPMLGETLLVDPLLTQVLPILDPSGTREVPLAIPADPALYGAAVFLQAGTLHLFPSEGDGLESSNGLALTVGF